jgi:hypothetical protein
LAFGAGRSCREAVVYVHPSVSIGGYRRMNRIKLQFSKTVDRGELDL